MTCTLVQYSVLLCTTLYYLIQFLCFGHSLTTTTPPVLESSWERCQKCMKGGYWLSIKNIDDGIFPSQPINENEETRGQPGLTNITFPTDSHSHSFLQVPSIKFIVFATDGNSATALKTAFYCIVTYTDSNKQTFDTTETENEK